MVLIIVYLGYIEVNSASGKKKFTIITIFFVDIFNIKYIYIKSISNNFQRFSQFYYLLQIARFWEKYDFYIKAYFFPKIAKDYNQIFSKKITFHENISKQKMVIISIIENNEKKKVID